MSPIEAHVFVLLCKFRSISQPMEAFGLNWIVLRDCSEKFLANSLQLIKALVGFAFILANCKITNSKTHSNVCKHKSLKIGRQKRINLQNSVSKYLDRFDRLNFFLLWKKHINLWSGECQETNIHVIYWLSDAATTGWKEVGRVYISV